MFPTFPAGWPGIGLSVLRAAVGVSLLAQGAAYLADWHDLRWSACAVGLLEIVCAVALLIGYLTPFAAVLAGLVSLGSGLSWFQDPSPNLFDTRLATALATSIAFAVVCLGPGAFSIDARLFGRREIIIPDASLPPEE